LPCDHRRQTDRSVDPSRARRRHTLRDIILLDPRRPGAGRKQRREVMRTRGTLSALAIIGILTLAGTAPALDVETWDQERVTDVATQFETVVDQLFRAARLETWEPMQRKNAIYLIVQDLRALRRHSTRLAAQLREGQGRDETLPLFERIERVVRDIRAKRGMAPILQGKEAEIDAARGKLEELSAFYGRTLPPVAAPPTKE
jgi:hypothetical protein